MQRLYQPLHISVLDTKVSIRWQRVARDQVNIRTGAASEQDSFSGLYTGINFRRDHIPDERITQRDQMHVCGKEKPWKILKGDEARAKDWRATHTKLPLDPIGLCTRRVKPKPQTILRLLDVL